MTPGVPPQPAQPESSWRRWLPALLVPVALLPDLAAALPFRTYFFRDFTATFYPLRLFAASEMREGRFPVWNPLIFEGSFHLPALYPLDLLHVLWPSPVWVSWLLTLHLPLAALTARWLARELGASREGAFVGGALYALGGLALSTLNLYVFLQALALGPLVVGLLRRGARDGGRWAVGAGVGLALALTTLTVEFVGQAVLLGVVLGLGLAETGLKRGVGRLAVALLLGVGLAGVPLAMTFGLLPETPRGTGFAADVGLGNAVHPAVLLQTVLPHLFGVPQAPAEAWWGGRFFSKGLPYFLSLYVGPLALATAFVGFRSVGPRLRLLLLVPAGLALWYALGEAGGLAPLVARLPLADAFRFPSKALLLPHLALALGVAFGVDALRRAAVAWPRLARALGAVVGVCMCVAALVVAAPQALVAWSGVVPSFWPRLVDVVARDAALAVALGVAGGGLALAVHKKRLEPGRASLLLSALLVADLARAGAGLNPQVAASFYDPLPEMAALLDQAPEDERVFSYGVDESPAFRRWLAQGGPGLTLAGTFMSRQALAPYSNIVDGVATPEAIDLTAFVPRARELEAADYAPERVGHVLPWLRNSAVGRLVSLDPLAHPDLELLGRVPAGPVDLQLHVYEVSDPWPRAYVACRVEEAPQGERALAVPFRPGFDPSTDAVIDEGAPAGCRQGQARRLEFRPGRERYEVQVDGPGYLVTRDSFARGWRATVDGREAPVKRANGKHRAVPVPQGRHEVVLRYHPPGLVSGLWLTLASLVTALGLWVRAGPGRTV